MKRKKINGNDTHKQCLLMRETVNYSFYGIIHLNHLRLMQWNTFGVEIKIANLNIETLGF